MRSDRIRPDLLWRLLVPVAALVALTTGAPRWASGGLALASLVLATDRLVRRRRAGFVDGVLVGVGGILVALVLTGVALDLARVALAPTSWILALTGLGLLGLVLAAVVPARAASTATGPARATNRMSRVAVLALAPWLVAATAVVVVAVHLSASSLVASDAPPLQMSLGRVDGTRVQVVVSSTEPIGPLELRTATGGDAVSYPLITVGRDDTVTTTVALPRTGRYVITVNYPDQTQPLRTLILDR